MDRVLDKLDIGPTPMSDHSAMIIAPGQNAWTDPFLVMGEEFVNQPGFEWHPHRGMETVTLILNGALEHGDSMGNSRRARAGGRAVDDRGAGHHPP